MKKTLLILGVLSLVSVPGAFAQEQPQAAQEAQQIQEVSQVPPQAAQEAQQVSQVLPQEAQQIQQVSQLPQTPQILQPGQTLKNFFPSGAIQSEHYPDTGLTKIYYENGKIAFEGHFKNLAEAEGVHKFYFDDGSLQKEQNWKAGKLVSKSGKLYTGIEKIPYKNGKVKEEIEFKKGERSGRHRTYYENGKIKVDAQYQKQALIKGKTYYETGELESEVESVNGKIVTKMYDKAGNIIQIPAASQAQGTQS